MGPKNGIHITEYKSLTKNNAVTHARRSTTLLKKLISYTNATTIMIRSWWFCIYTTLEIKGANIC
jgi:hypothetical protein